MRLNYVKESAVAELRKSIEYNKAMYSESASWMGSFFSGRPYLAESRIAIASLPELKNPETAVALFELENTIALHTALKDLTPSQAADERLWVWLAHGPYWDYMRHRWPVENAKTSFERYVLEHYFLGDVRSLVRHGLARLWWFGYCTYVPNAEDPYALTRMLLHTTDARASLLERKFWRNQAVLHAVLRRVAHWRSNELDFFVPRERFRRLCKTFNIYGGTLLLDSLEEPDIYGLVDGIASSEQAAPSQA
jgi:hypothetical protein